MHYASQKNNNNITTKTTFKSIICSKKIVTFYPNTISKYWPSDILPTIGSFIWTFVDSNSSMYVLLFPCIACDTNMNIYMNLSSDTSSSCLLMCHYYHQNVVYVHQHIQ